MRFAPRVALALLVLVALACESGPKCPPQSEQCGGLCVDTRFDPAHCGACGAACSAPSGGAAACVAGACLPTCPAGLILCDDACVDVTSDALHCGRCDRSCASPAGGTAQCHAGECEQACPDGLVACDGLCLDIAGDPDRCGGCDRVCVAPEGGSATCASGSCGVDCAPGLSLCSDACRDLSADPQNCGACGVVCESPEGGLTACVDSRCVQGCPVGLTACDGRCLAVQEDLANCGGCGVRCESPEGGTARCLAGQCERACPLGLIDCAGRCVDVSSSPDRCGRCDLQCDAPQGGLAVCAAGTCDVECAPSLAPCAGACLDLANDPENCGRCGRSCEPPAGGEAACALGACTPRCPAGLAPCASGCLDLSRNGENCGACGHRCEAPEGGSVACAAGRCVQSCPAGLTPCEGRCLDTRADSANCGACGRSCVAAPGGLAVCTEGTCAFACEAGLTACDTGCFDLAANIAHCGACGRTCPAIDGGDATCSNGACGGSCPDGRTLCDTRCVDLLTDPTRCGGCDIRCSGDESCSAGLCRTLPPRIDRLSPTELHAAHDSEIWIHGARFLGAVEVAAVRGARREPLFGVLSRGDLVRATVPSGLPPGAWDLELTAAGGTVRAAGALQLVDGPLRIDLLEAGQGDASLIRGPTGRSLVIDGSIFGMGQSRLVPRLPSPPDYVVVSHFDADHLAGVYEVLAGPDQLPNTADDVNPRVALLDHGDNHACRSTLCRNYLTLRARLEAEGLAREIVPGEVLDLGAGATATCVFVNGRLSNGQRAFTASENENSVGLLVEFGGFRYYAGGDITGGRIAGCSAAISGSFADVEGSAARLIGEVDAMKVSHHGSCTATPAGLPAHLLPTAALVSVGLDNSYCHPARRVLFNLARLGTELFLTNPGVVRPDNTSACPLTERPASTRDLYGNLTIEATGRGTFTTSVTDGTSTLGRTYPVKAERTHRPAPPATWTDEPGVALLSARTGAPPAGPFVVELAQAPLRTLATLLPWALVDDLALAAVEDARQPSGAATASVVGDGRRLSVVPASALAPRTDWALVLPRRATGLSRPLVVRFETGAGPDTTGPRATLTPPLRASGGAVLNLAELELAFDEPVTGMDGTVLVEERLTSADGVMADVVPLGDGRSFRLRLPQLSRVGLGNVSCQALCPGLEYAVRLTGRIRDASGNPVDLGSELTFTTGTCHDLAAPTVQPAQVRQFAGAVTLSVAADEPLLGELRLARSDRFASDCEPTPTAACRRFPLSTGTCTGEACRPVSGDCPLFAIDTQLAAGAEYRYAFVLRDSADRTPATPVGGLFTVAPPGPVPVLTEVLANAATTPENAGEFIEAANAGSADFDACTLRLGRSTSELLPVCPAGQSILVPPGGSVLFGGSGFCDARVQTCPAGAFTLLSGQPLARAVSGSLFSTGIANSPLPSIFLMTASGTVLSQIPGGGTCPQGQSRTRTSLYAPDAAGSFACASASPGLLP
jgi:beta-lactamase superfamily II metal-dependent hydrolase